MKETPSVDTMGQLSVRGIAITTLLVRENERPETGRSFTMEQQLYLKASF